MYDGKGSEFDPFKIVIGTLASNAAFLNSSVEGQTLFTETLSKVKEFLNVYLEGFQVKQKRMSSREVRNLENESLFLRSHLAQIENKLGYMVAEMTP